MNDPTEHERELAAAARRSEEAHAAMLHIHQDPTTDAADRQAAKQAAAEAFGHWHDVFQDTPQRRAEAAYHNAVTAAQTTWLEQHPDEPWPGTFAMTDEQKTALGIPAPPTRPEPEPLPPHLDPAGPEFDADAVRFLHPSMLSDQAARRVTAQRAVLTEAENIVRDADHEAEAG